MKPVMDTWQVRLFGTLTLTRRDRSVGRFRTRRAAALFAYLALNAGKELSRDETIRAIWPDAPLEPGRARLRQELAALRRQLEEPGETLFLADRNSLSLAEGAIQTDMAKFCELLSGGRGETDVSRLEEAVELYRGELLRDLPDDWVLAERERLHERQSGALARLIELERDPERSLEWARKAVVHEPLGEAALLRLMRLLDAQGRARDARRAFDDFAARLKKERSEEPSAFAQGAARALGRVARTGESTASAPDLPPVQPTERVEQRRLPMPLTRFFGREDELAWLNLAWSDGARLVTLSGPGGSGKTRLAIEAARRDPGAIFVPLSAVETSERIADRIAEALGLPPAPRPEPQERVAQSLAERESPLLVLDSCEGVAAGAGELARELLESVEGLRVLATSRQALLVSGEREFPLPPLATPPPGETDLEALYETPSVRLFVDRARAVRRDFALTPRNAALLAALCRRLDGIPLGLELAASQVGAFSVGEILERVEASLDALQSRARDLPERHRSLRAAIDGSVQDLGEDVRRFFGQLSLFRGGWSREAAEALDPLARERLETLRNRSLLSVAEDDFGLRWSMLEPLRDYASALLSPEERILAERLHGEFFAAYVPRSATKVDALERERDNVRAAAAWAVRESPALALRLAHDLREFFHIRGPLAEGRDLARAALNVGSDSDLALQAGASFAAGFLARLAGDFADARTHHERARALYGEIGDERGVARALNNLGVVARVTGDFDEARARYAEALALRQKLGDVRDICASLNNLGVVARASGDLEEARRLLSEGLSLAKTLNQPLAEGPPRINLGNVETDAGRFADARAHFRAALEVYVPVGSRVALAEIGESVARILAEEGNAHEAARFWAGAERSRELLGAPLTPADLAELRPRFDAAKVTLGPIAFADAWREGRALPFDDWLAAVYRKVRLSDEPPLEFRTA